MKQGAIWIIDDDSDDQDMVREVCGELNLSNELVFINRAEDAMERLRQAAVAPFIILCNVKLNGTDGFALRELLLTGDKKMKSVPFIYWSEVASEQQITHAYNLSAHGFFIKEQSFKEMRQTFMDILRYWSKSRMPSKTG